MEQNYQVWINQQWGFACFALSNGRKPTYTIPNNSATMEQTVILCCSGESPNYNQMLGRKMDMQAFCEINPWNIWLQCDEYGIAIRNHISRFKK